MSLHNLLNLFPRWPLVFRSFLLSPLVARDVVTPKSISDLFEEDWLVAAIITHSNVISPLTKIAVYCYLDLASPSSSEQRSDKMASFRNHQIYLLFLLLVKFHGSGKSEIYSPVQRTLQRFLPCAILSLDISRKRRPFISERHFRPNDFRTPRWLFYFKI